MPGLCRAASYSANDIKMSSVFGFNGILKTGAWTPVSIILENKGKPLENGILEITVTRGDEFNRDIYHTRYTQRVDLPSGSKKVFRFNVLIETHLHPVKISFYKDGRPVVAKTEDIRQYVTQKPILLIAKKTLSHDFLGSMPENFKPAVVHARHLPHQWKGYQGVGVMVAWAGILSRLEPAQTDALLRWLETGGTIVSSGSINTSIFSSGRVKKVLQLSVQGVEKLKTAASLAAFSNVQKEIPTALWVNHTRMEGASVLASQDEIPLVLSKKIKDGRVLFINFDTDAASFLRWKGAGDFWQKILSQAAAPGDFLNQPDDGEVLDLIVENALKITPPFLTAILLLGGYLACMALLLRQSVGVRKKKPLQALAFGLAITLFSVMALNLYFKQTDFSQAVSITKVMANRAKLARVTYTGIYSPMAAQKRFDLGSSSDIVQIVSPPGQDKKTWLDSTFIMDRRRQYLDVVFGRFDVFHYKKTQVLDSPFKGFVQVSDSAEISLQLENLSKTPVFNSFLYYDNNVFFIGDIPADTQVARTLKIPVAQFESGVTSDEMGRLKAVLKDNRPDVFQGKLATALLEIIIRTAGKSRGSISKTATMAGFYNPEQDTLKKGVAWLLWQMTLTNEIKSIKGGDTG